jgi:hypothetical protein
MTNSQSNLFLAFGLIIIAAIGVKAQNQRPVRSNSPERQESKTTVDETFDLNIPERHITENNFAASTAVEIGDHNKSDLRLQVGVALEAERIDVTLRNVTGTVHFRGSLQRILDLVSTRPKALPPR